MNKYKHISTYILLVMLGYPCFVLSEQMNVLQYPYEIKFDKSNLVVHNISDKYMILTLEIKGNNFIIKRICEFKVFVGAKRQVTVELGFKEKNFNKAIDFGFFVKGFSLKTIEQLKSESMMKKMPEIVRLDKEKIRKAIDCQSNQ